MFERNEEPLAEIIAVLHKTKFSELQAPTGKVFVLRDSLGFFLVNWKSGAPIRTTFATNALRFADLRLAACYGKFWERTGLVGTAPIFISQIDLPRQIQITGYGKTPRAEQALPRLGRVL